MFLDAGKLHILNIRPLRTAHLHLLWLLVPILIYLLLFFLNPQIQSLFSKKEIVPSNPTPNFIVQIDKFMFNWLIYRFIPNVENIVFDFMAAIPYLIHFTLPFAYSTWLLVRCKSFARFMQFLLGFGLMCAFCVIIQQIIPTPPPWMLSNGTYPPEAAFHRIDALIRVPLFKKLYGKSPLVCGAFPSLHAAWPSLILFVKSWISPWFCVGHVTLICLAAVYSMHHWIIDVVFGIAIAWCFAKVSSYVVENWLVPRLPKSKVGVDVEVISTGKDIVERSVVFREADDMELGYSISDSLTIADNNSVHSDDNLSICTSSMILQDSFQSSSRSAENISIAERGEQDNFSSSKSNTLLRIEFAKKITCSDICETFVQSSSTETS